MTLAEWTKNVRTKIGEPLVPDTHKPTDNERNNIVHLSFQNIFGHSFREADLAIVESMASDIADMRDLKERYIPTLGEYIWDHWMGEPQEPSQLDVVDACQALADMLYTMNTEIRNSIDNKIGEQQ